MRITSEIQADLDALDLKRVRPLAELIQSGDTDTVALARLRDIDAQVAVLRAEYRDAAAYEAQLMAEWAALQTTQIVALTTTQIPGL